MPDAIAAVRQAFMEAEAPTTRMPPKVYLSIPEHDGDFRAMPAATHTAAGIKWVNSHPHNPERFGIPAVMGLYILSDPKTARARAVMDGTVLTAMRTGAAAAVATQALARPEATTLGILGCGAQSAWILRAHRALNRKWEVLAADRDADRARQFAAQHGARAVSVEHVCRDAEVLCSSTPARSPVIQSAWVSAGAHLNAMGADAPGKQEVDEALLHRARVYLDNIEQGSESGEVNVPLHHGRYTIEAIAGTLSATLHNPTLGRQGPEDVTLFDSTGLAVQDLSLAQRAWQAAEQKSVGVSFAF